MNFAPIFSPLRQFGISEDTTARARSEMVEIEIDGQATWRLSRSGNLEMRWVDSAAYSLTA